MWFKVQYLYDRGLKHKKKTVKALYNVSILLIPVSEVAKNNSQLITRPSDESDNLTVTDIFVCRSLVSLVKVAVPQLLVSQQVQ